MNNVWVLILAGVLLGLFIWVMVRVFVFLDPLNVLSVQQYEAAPAGRRLGQNLTGSDDPIAPAGELITRKAGE